MASLPRVLCFSLISLSKNLVRKDMSVGHGSPDPKVTLKVQILNYSVITSVRSVEKAYRTSDSQVS